jgi:hypothetical protein
MLHKKSKSSMMISHSKPIFKLLYGSSKNYNGDVKASFVAYKSQN